MLELEKMFSHQHHLIHLCIVHLMNETEDITTTIIIIIPTYISSDMSVAQLL